MARRNMKLGLKKKLFDAHIFEWRKECRKIIRLGTKFSDKLEKSWRRTLDEAKQKLLSTLYEDVLQLIHAL